MRPWAISAMVMILVGCAGVLYAYNNPPKASTNPAVQQQYTNIQPQQPKGYWDGPWMLTLAGAVMISGFGILLGLPAAAAMPAKFAGPITAIFFVLLGSAIQPSDAKLVTDLSRIFIEYFGHSITSVVMMMAIGATLAARSVNEK